MLFAAGCVSISVISANQKYACRCRSSFGCICRDRKSFADAREIIRVEVHQLPVEEKRGRRAEVSLRGIETKSNRRVSEHDAFLHNSCRGRNIEKYCGRGMGVVGARGRYSS